MQWVRWWKISREEGRGRNKREKATAVRWNRRCAWQSVLRCAHLLIEGVPQVRGDGQGLPRADSGRGHVHLHPAGQRGHAVPVARRAGRLDDAAGARGLRERDGGFSRGEERAGRSSVACDVQAVERHAWRPGRVAALRCEREEAAEQGAVGGEASPHDGQAGGGGHSDGASALAGSAAGDGDVSQGQAGVGAQVGSGAVARARGGGYDGLGDAGVRAGAEPEETAVSGRHVAAALGSRRRSGERRGRQPARVARGRQGSCGQRRHSRHPHGPSGGGSVRPKRHV